MGNSHASLKNFVEVGEEIPRVAAIYRLWDDVRSCVEDKRRKCTLFSRQFIGTNSDETRRFYENGLKALRQLRHPYIVSYVSSDVSFSEIWLLTERLQMLDLIIDSLSAIEIHTGLTHILDALVFLHDKAQISHNNVCPLSIFVNLDGRWKLGGFECAQKMAAAKHWVQTNFVRSVKMSDFAPPEDKMMLSVDIPPTARDVYAFGKLICYVMPYLKDHLIAETIGSLTEIAKRLTEDDASKRGELGGLSAAYPEAFTNHLTAAVDFLQNQHSKSSVEKQEFFLKVVDQLRPMPEEVIGRHLIPLLLSRHILLDSFAHENLIPVILQPTVEVDNENKIGLLREAAFRKWVIPVVMKIFRVHETTVRLALLAHFHLYMRYFTQSQLDIVLAELSLGMQDTHDEVVSASLHAMARLVTIIGGPAVTGLVHTKTFADGTPKKSGIYSCERLCESQPATDATNDSSTTEREVSVSPMSNLSRLLNDDELLPETPAIKLQLRRTDEKENVDSTADDWTEAWEVEQGEFLNKERKSAMAHQNPGTSQITNSKLPDTNRGIERGNSIEAAYGIPEISVKMSHENDPDFFSDMVPVVLRAPSLNFKIEEMIAAKQNPPISRISKRFAAEIGSWDLAAAENWDTD